MKTITDDLIEKFIEVGLINLQSIDQVRSLEMIRAEFKEIEKNDQQQSSLAEHLEWLKQELQRVIDDGESESWVYAYQRAIKNAESLIKKYNDEQI